MIVQITAPHFCAGIVIADWQVIDAAPILRYMLGWSEARLMQYCQFKRWAVTRCE